MPPKSGKTSASKAKGRGMKKGGNMVTGQTRAGLIFAPARCGRLFREGRYARRQGMSAGVFMAGVLQYLCEEILELSGKVCLQDKRKQIAPKHLNHALRSDDELSKMLFMSTISEGGQLSNIADELLQGKAKKDLKASQVV